MEFEDIPKKKLKLSTPVLYVVFFTSFLILWISFLIFTITTFNFPLYHPLFIRIIFWMVLLLFLVSNFTIIFFRRKSALYFYNEYYRENNSERHLKSRAETFCRGCGIVISNEIFKDSDTTLIKPTTIYFIKGYFCKKCYQKFYKHWQIGTVLFIITFPILYLPVYFLYWEELSEFELYYIPFLFIFSTFLTILVKSRWKKYLAKYH
ncbi:MAG: hypothetical protein ACTSPD_11830 [Promethearchaeota archaeon]